MTELAHNALAGPFMEELFEDRLVLSVLHMVEKKNGGDARRVVLDLSFPAHTSVNAGIPKDSYLGEDFPIEYPFSGYIYFQTCSYKSEE